MDFSGVKFRSSCELLMPVGVRPIDNPGKTSAHGPRVGRIRWVAPSAVVAVIALLEDASRERSGLGDDGRLLG